MNYFIRELGSQNIMAKNKLQYSLCSVLTKIPFNTFKQEYIFAELFFFFNLALMLFEIECSQKLRKNPTGKCV